MPGETVHLSDSTFEAEVLQANGPVLVHFWAEWAGPCKMIKPILEEVAAEREGRMIGAELNIDQNPNTHRKYKIEAIPTLLMFENGAVIGTRVGPLSKSQVVEFIDALL